MQHCCKGLLACWRALCVNRIPLPNISQHFWTDQITACPCVLSHFDEYRAECINLKIKPLPTLRRRWNQRSSPAGRPCWICSRTSQQFKSSDKGHWYQSITSMYTRSDILQNSYHHLWECTSPLNFSTINLWNLGSQAVTTVLQCITKLAAIKRFWQTIGQIQSAAILPWTN